MTGGALHGSEPGRQALAGAFVLVVDDDRDTREELHDYLKGHGMHVETAGDVTGARHRLQLRKFDLVLLDLWQHSDCPSRVRLYSPATVVHRES